MSQSVVVVQHVDFEGPGEIARWAEERRLDFQVAHAYRGDRFPDPRLVDLVVLMGGPMAVYERSRYPWFAPELEFVGRAMGAGAGALGICLGAQLLAHLLGARVAAGEEAEIGWFPVRLTEGGRSHPLFADFPDQFNALHWHGDFFDLPEGADHIAESDGCRTQAFVWGARTVGLQFHLETTATLLDQLIARSYADQPEGRFVSSESELRGGVAAANRNSTYLFSLLDRILAGSGRGEQSGE